MNFNNLTDEQITWLEGKIKEAYEEGFDDGCFTYQDSSVSVGFSESLAKNETCHILAARYMVPVEG